MCTARAVHYYVSAGCSEMGVPRPRSIVVPVESWLSRKSERASLDSAFIHFAMQPCAGEGSSQLCSQNPGSQRSILCVIE